MRDKANNITIIIMIIYNSNERESDINNNYIVVVL